MMPMWASCSSGLGNVGAAYGGMATTQEKMLAQIIEITRIIVRLQKVELRKGMISLMIIINIQERAVHRIARAIPMVHDFLVSKPWRLTTYSTNGEGQTFAIENWLMSRLKTVINYTKRRW
jgi:hypothetical protein